MDRREKSWTFSQTVGLLCGLKIDAFGTVTTLGGIVCRGAVGTHSTVVITTEITPDPSAKQYKLPSFLVSAISLWHVFWHVKQQDTILSKRSDSCHSMRCTAGHLPSWPSSNICHWHWEDRRTNFCFHSVLSHSFFFYDIQSQPEIKVDSTLCTLLMHILVLLWKVHIIPKMFVFVILHQNVITCSDSETTLLFFPPTHFFSLNSVTQK